MKEDAARPSFDLKPPPGRVGSGIPPLKPPPGRSDPLTPEPQSVKTTDFAVNPPPPPPPPRAIPPAPPKPSGGGPPPAPPPKPGNGGPKPPPPPPPGAKPGGPRPPPPPKSGVRAPPPFGQKGPRPLAGGSKVQEKAAVGSESEGDGPKTKLKPFFWDKVQANSDQTMVWNQLKAGSFQ